MTPERHARIREIFLAACERPADQRPVFLEEACGADRELRGQVERLLDCHTSTPSVEPEKQALFGAETVKDRHAHTPGHPGERPPADPAYAFLPGQMVADRYRIVAPIGQGGMGCVYRADDLTLHQTVALKFLSAEHAFDPVWLGRFRQEVRLARDVTHPNVCRVHDLSEADGIPFISMEYVDGEDLAGLLRRIGRVPEDKGVELAGQICAGLAAAHVRGVLHRDLKPGNIMIDGRGRVRITDFGLAGLVGRVRRGEIRSGTPRYMAPEQITGVAVSEKSDIYSLGLVLYELFTGKPAFAADDFFEYLKLHKSADAADPSSIVAGLDPKIVQVIRACLRKDPAARPDSALAVAASLPGADLLAAALAIGETPSPEMLDVAAKDRHVRHRVLVGSFIAFAALFVLHFVLVTVVHPAGGAAVPKSPDVLADKAREIIAAGGYSPGPAAMAIEPAERMTPELTFEVPPPRPLTYRLPSAPRGELAFWCRQSPAPLVPLEAANVLFADARVTLDDPPPTRPGMVTTVLDSAGRLLLLQGNPSPGPASREQTPAADWPALFRHAGLEEQAFQPTAPLLLPRSYASERQAWVSRTAAGSDGRLWVEGAADRGQVVHFAVLAETDPEAASIWTDTEFRHRFTQALRGAALFIVTIVAIPCAWRNVKSGRSDRRGAIYLGCFIVAIRLAIWLMLADHVSKPLAEAELLAYGLLGSVIEGALACLFYLALEPYVRRLWPQTLLGWSKVLRGHLRDPLVTGNIVVGGLVGVFWAVMLALERLIPVWFGWSVRTDYRLFGDLSYLLGTRQTLGRCLDLLYSATYQGLFYLLLTVLIRVFVRRSWLAATLATLIIALMFVPIGTHPIPAWVLIGGGLIAVAGWAVVRYGLVTIVAALFVCSVLNQFTMIPWGSSYRFADLAVFSRLLPAALVLWAFVEALAHRSLRPIRAPSRKGDGE